MDKHLKRIRIMDTMVLYLGCLILTLLLNTFLTPVIGVFARMISMAAVIALVLVSTKRTGQKFSAVFPVKEYKIRSALGTATVLSGTLLLAVPFVLLFHIIAPNFAVTGYHIVDLSPSGAKYLWVCLLVLLTAAANTMLFDGYLHQGLKGIQNKIARFLLIPLLYAVFFGDLYVFLPLFIMEMGIRFVREQTQSIKLPFIMHLFSSSGAFALLQLSAKGSSFIGEAEGALNIIGMAMIFIGVAALLLWASLSLFDKKNVLTPFGKLMTVVLFIIFLAIGSGLTSL